MSLGTAVSAHPIRALPSTPSGLLWRVVSRHRAAVVGSAVLLSLWQLSEAMVPIAAGVVIDRAISAGSVVALFGWGTMLLLAFVSLIYTYRFGAKLAVTVRQQETHLLRMEIADHVLHPRGARTGMLAGEALSLATSDADAVGTAARSLSFTIGSVAAVVVSSLALLRIDVLIGLVVLIGIPAVLAAIQMTSPAISRRSRKQRASIGEASGVATDLIKGLRILKGVGAEDVAASRYRARSRQAMLAGMHTARSLGAVEALTVGASAAFLGLVALLAGLRALDASISIGELVSIIGLTQFLTVPIAQLGRVSAQLASAHASARRIVDFLGTPRLVGEGSESPDWSELSLSLKDVTVGALNGLSIDSSAGELLCIVADDPAAAVAVSRLLTGELVAPEFSGSAEVNSVPIADLTGEWLRSHVVVNPYEASLLEGTLRSNADPLGRHSDAMVTTFLDLSAAHDVLRQEGGLDQHIKLHGSNLSGGQRQRVALARALAAQSSFLMLVDPTSAVDSVTEQEIAAGIRKARHGPSSTLITWIVTRSPALLAQADRVVVLRAGRVALQGRHDELLVDSDYCELVLR